MNRAGRTILILGGGVMQIPALEFARELGLRVVMADGNPACPGVRFADEFWPVDLKDTDTLAKKAAELVNNGGLHGVFTAGTDFSASVAYVAEALSLPGIPYLTALKASRKDLMREVFAEAGLPSPAFVSLADPASARDLPFGFPVVVKPVDNMGARGIRRVDTVDELQVAVREALEHSRSGQAIVEEYVPGPEFSLDALIHDGEVRITGVADRHIRFSPYFIEMGHTIPSNHDRVNEVVDLFVQGIRALGLTLGAAKGDIKLGPSGPVIGEIAARLSGGYMSGWTYPFSSGVPLTEAGIRLALGEGFGDLEPRWRQVSAERAGISVPGTVRRVIGKTALDAFPGIKASFMRVSPGEIVAFPVNNVQKAFNVIAQANDGDTAARQAEEAVRSVFIELEPGDPATEDFLLRRRDRWVPDAFSFPDSVVRDAVASLPPLRQVDGEGLSGLGILPLSVDPGSVFDWVGRDWDASLELASLSAAERPRYLLGRPFWEAFLRGGAQGGRWILDTLRSVPESELEGHPLCAAWS